MKKEKELEISKLVKKRKQNCYPGYLNLSDVCDGYYECDYVSPYSISAHNLDAYIMVMGQDWSSEESLNKPKYRRNEEMKCQGYIDLPTNGRLFGLLDRHFHVKFGDTYSTNLFPFIKHGPVSGPIHFQDLRRAAKEYGIPQIDIIQPKLVICLGLATYNAIRIELGCGKAHNLDDAIGNPFRYNPFIYCQAHPGGNIYRNRPQFEEDWKNMADWRNFNRRK